MEEKKMALHELAEGSQIIARLIEENDETSLMREALDGIAEQIEEKIRNCGYVYRNMQAEQELLAARAEIYKTEYERIMGNVKTLANKSERLRSYCEFNMRSLNIAEVKADTFTAKFHKLPDMVEIPNEDIVPFEYQLPPASPRPDRKRILEAIKAGREFDWAMVLKNRAKLEFK